MSAPPTDKPPHRRGILAPGATFVILLAIYAATACPTVFTSMQATDSGELIAAIHTLGVSHPTGYPLYMLLGRLFEAVVPFGEVAYRLNLLSALFAAAAGALICWAIILAGGSRPAGLLGGLSSGLFATVWGEAGYAEVYALNMLLMALAWLAYCRCATLRHSEDRRRRALVWLAAAAGLGLAHHRTALFFSGPLLVAAFALHRPLCWKTAVKMAAAFLAPLLLYLYLPLRAAADPPVNWGAADTWNGFWWHVSGALYAPYVFARSGPELGDWLKHAALAARAQIGWVGLAFALLGAVWMIAAPTLTGPLPGRERSGRRALGVCLALGFALTLGWSATYAAGDAGVFLLPCYLVLGWWLAEAADGVGRTLGRFADSPGRVARVGTYVAPVLMVLLPLRLATGNWQEVDKHAAWFGDEWAQTVFAQFLPGSLALLTGDSANGIAQYYQAVKGERPDVTILSADHANHEWYARRVADPRLRGVVTATALGWRQASIENLGTWQGTLAHAVATQYPERLPMHVNFEMPPLPDGYWVQQRVRLATVSTTPPELLEPDPPGARPVALQFGISLLGARAGDAPLRRGRAAAIRLSWRCEQPVESPALVALSLVLADRLEEAEIPPSAEIPGERPWGFSVTTPLVFGLTPLEPTPPGWHYAQQVWLVPPQALIPGRYAIRVGLAGEGWQAGPQTAGEVEIR